MNYLKQTEKFLKTSLKGKVNLTTGVMVAFLLTGNLSFAATEITNATKVPITQGGEYILGESNVTLKNEEVIFSGNSKITVNENQSLNLYRTKIDEINGVISNAEILGNGNIFLEGRIGLGIGTNSITANSITLNTGTVGISGYTKKTTLEANNIDIKSNWFGIQFQGDGNGKIEIKNFENLSIYAREVDGIQQAYNTTESNLFISGKDTGILNITAGRNAIRHLYGNNTIQAGKIILNSVGEGIYVEEGTLNLNGNISIYKIDQATENNFNIISNTDVITTKKENGSVYLNKINTDKEIKINGNIKSTGLVEANFGSNTSYLNGNAQTINKGTINLSFYNGATWNTRGDSIVTELTLNGGKINNNYNIKVSEPIEMLGSSNGYNSILTGSGSYSKIGTGNLVEISNQGNEFNLSSGANFNGDIVVNEGASLLNKGVFSVNGKVENSGTITLNSGTTINLKADSSFTNKEGATLVVNSGATAVTGGSATNNGRIILENTQNDSELSKLVNNSKLTSNGTIQLNDYFGEKMSKEEKDLLITKLTSNGEVNITGLITNQNGDAIYKAGIEISGDNTLGGVIDESKENESIKIEEDITISGSKNEDDDETHVLKDKVINVGGNLTFESVSTDVGVKLEEVLINIENNKNITTIGKDHIFNNTSINLNGNSNIIIGNGKEETSLVISGGNITSDETPSVIQTTENSTLILEKIEVGIDIKGHEEKGNGNIITLDDTILNSNIVANNVHIKGETTLNGQLNFGKLVIGILNSAESTIKKLVLSSSAKLKLNKTSVAMLSTTKERNDNAIIIAKDGQLVLEVDKNGNTALTESDAEIKKEGSTTDNSKADILFYLSNESVGERLDIKISENCKFEDGLIFALDSKIYVLHGDKNTGFYIEYNQQLTDIYKELNDLNKLAVYAGEYLSLNKDTRITQLDKLYTSSIYSETVKAAYDGIKASEEVILNLDTPITVGEWTSVGAALYNKSDYDKKGVIGESYNTTTDTSGLLGAMEYGINDTASIGFVFSGAKQSVDSIGGSADGTLLYLGAYSRKEMGNHLFTTGIGYQFANYDAKNSAGSLSTSNKYSSNALSLYGKAVYSFNFENNITLQPKVKIGYTYIDQEDATDNYFTVKDANISSFDMEIGTDLIKTVAISDGKVDLALGVSYIRVMGDTDKEFKGGFVGKDGTTKILGAQLAENTGKVNFDVTVSKDNGFNYNAGVYMKAGSDKNRSYGATVGIGYKF